jgi:uncharacterized protein (DUF1697 family)
MTHPRRMANWVALLRAINVGGARKVPMKDLRALFVEEGFRAVRTYVASGNVVFEADAPPDDARLKAAIHERFGHPDVPVLVLEAARLRAILAAHPFDGEDADGGKVAVGFLGAPLTGEGRERLAAHDAGRDALALGADALYLRYPDGMGRSKNGHGVLERLLGVPVTVRNLRTVRKLVAMVTTPAR